MWVMDVAWDESRWPLSVINSTINTHALPTYFVHTSYIHIYPDRCIAYDGRPHLNSQPPPAARSSTGWPARQRLPGILLTKGCHSICI